MNKVHFACIILKNIINKSQCIQYYIWLYLVISCLGLLPGCNSWGNDFIIPNSKLPKGWSLFTMPIKGPSDKLPWLENNPQYLDGKKLDAAREYLDFNKQPTKAINFLSVGYVNTINDEYYEIAIFAYKYLTSDDMNAEYDSAVKEFETPEDIPIDEYTQENFIGYANKYDKTIVILSLKKNCPDKEFFINYFKEYTKPK